MLVYFKLDPMVDKQLGCDSISVAVKDVCEVSGKDAVFKYGAFDPLTLYVSIDFLAGVLLSLILHLLPSLAQSFEYIE